MLEKVMVFCGGALMICGTAMNAIGEDPTFSMLGAIYCAVVAGWPSND